MRKIIEISTHKRGIYPISVPIEHALIDVPASDTMCNIFVMHTSCSLIITENTDPNVLKDIETFFSSLVPDSTTKYKHSAEGKDDMPAHIRSLLCHTSLSIPIEKSQLLMGVWQGIFLYEHRIGSFNRKVVLTSSK